MIRYENRPPKREYVPTQYDLIRALDMAYWCHYGGHRNDAIMMMRQIVFHAVEDTLDPMIGRKKNGQTPQP